MPLIITPDLAIPDEEFEWKFIRSSGPGGQNVNKVASAVQLRFLLPQNTSLPVAVRNRLRRLAGQKINDDGTILISAAMIEPKIRKKTRPTRASKERRIETKKRRGSTKQGRGSQSWD